MDNKRRERYRFFIPVNGVPVEVDETVYRAYYQPIWRTRINAFRAMECHCPRNKLWLCDGVCPGCDYYLPKNIESLEKIKSYELDGLVNGDSLIDYSQKTELLALERELIDALFEAIHKLEPENRQLCLLMMRYSEREAAKKLNVSRVTISRRWSKIKKQLKGLLQDCFLE
jgi:RNA polymerase sigma factor (sigma-70 family)